MELNPSRLQNEIDYHRKNRSRAEHEIDRKTRIREVVKGLSETWADRDPGKSRTAYWLVSKESGRKAVAKNSLPEGVDQFSGSEEEWRDHLRELDYWRPFDVVPPSMEVLDNSDEAKKCPCPKCETSQPMIVAYHQTHDSPDGDIWEKRRLFCVVMMFKS